jgi:hypothetical protein
LKTFLAKEKNKLLVCLPIIQIRIIYKTWKITQCLHLRIFYLDESLSCLRISVQEGD